MAGRHKRGVWRGARGAWCGRWPVFGWWLAGCGHRQGFGRAGGHQEPCREPCGARMWRETDGSRTEPGRGEARGNESPGGATGCISRGVPRPESVLLPDATFVARTFVLAFLLVSSVFSPSVHPCVQRVRPPLCALVRAAARCTAHRPCRRPLHRPSSPARRPPSRSAPSRCRHRPSSRSVPSSCRCPPFR